MKSPVWVPSNVRRTATLSPSPTTSSIGCLIFREGGTDHRFELVEAVQVHGRKPGEVFASRSKDSRTCASGSEKALMISTQPCSGRSSPLPREWYGLAPATHSGPPNRPERSR